MNTPALLEFEGRALETDSQSRLAVVRLQGADNGKRNEMDFYPTPAACTEALLDYLQIPTAREIWEPACGDGAISKVLERAGYVVWSHDLRPDTYGESCLDFLQARAPAAPVIVTNPPFNRAEEFIRHSHRLEVPLIAMLLKAQYFHAAERLTLFRAFPPALVLALAWRPCFRPELKAGGTMDFCWFVWKRGAVGTHYDVLQRGGRSAQGDLFGMEEAAL